MRHRCTRKSKVGRKGGQNGLSCAIFSAYSTRVNAGIAQLVEQLICNQQVVGSNPTAGSCNCRLPIFDWTNPNLGLGPSVANCGCRPPSKVLLRYIWYSKP